MRTVKFFSIATLIIAALLLVACGGNDAAPDTAVPDTAASVGDAVKGKTLYQQSCASCHGQNGEGVPGLGKDMAHSDFINGLTDAELVEFIKQGRSASDPLNTTNIDMPPKGGNPALNDEGIYDIVAFIRSIRD
jgi:mono/diheme cytochrome c family protein